MSLWEAGSIIGQLEQTERGKQLELDLFWRQDGLLCFNHNSAHYWIIGWSLKLVLTQCSEEAKGVVCRKGSQTEPSIFCCCKFHSYGIWPYYDLWTPTWDKSKNSEQGWCFRTATVAQPTRWWWCFTPSFFSQWQPLMLFSARSQRSNQRRYKKEIVWAIWKMKIENWT